MLETALFVGALLLWLTYGIMSDLEKSKPKATTTEQDEENKNMKEGKRHV